MIPWLRWPALPLCLFAAGMAASFWPDRALPGAWLWLGLAALLGYAAGACLLNRTTLVVEAGVLVVRHRPLPFPGQRLPAAELQALGVRCRPDAESDAVGWELVAYRVDGRVARLAWGPIGGHRRDALEAVGAALAAELGVPMR